MARPGLATCKALAAPLAPVPARRAAATRRATVTCQAKGGAKAAAPPAEELSVVEERLPEGKVRLSVTVPESWCRQAYRDTVESYRERVAIDGYRKGKAPDSAVVRELGGPGPVKNSALSALLEPVIEQVMAPFAATAVPDTEAIEQAGPDLEALYSPDAPLSFSIAFEVFPGVKWSTPYADLAVEVAAAGDAESDAAAAAAKLLTLRKDRGVMRVVTGRGVQHGDVVILDFSAARADGGEELPGTQREGMQLDTAEADRVFLPGVVDAMEGMVVGDERVAPITLPNSEGFQPAALRGVKTLATIRVKEVFEYDLPEADDAFAASIVPGLTMAALTERLENIQREETAAATRSRMVDAFASAVAAALDVEVPRSMVEEQGRKDYAANLQELMAKGVMGLEQVQQLSSPNLVGNFVKRKWDSLVEMQKAQLGFGDIAEQEGIIAEAHEVEEQLALAAEEFKSYKQEYDADRLREQVEQTVVAEKVINWLSTNCRVTILPYSPEA